MSRQKKVARRPPPRPDVPVRVVRKHHALVRLAHWSNVPLLFGLIASGLAIYWAAPVFVRHDPAAAHGRDILLDAGRAISNALRDPARDPRTWIYDHVSLGPHLLAPALRLHWLLAYLFMLNGVLYAVGLLAGGGWRALLPRPSDVTGALAMVGYYWGVIPMAILRRPWPHPPVHSKYNALQRAAYFTMPLAGLLVVLSGWAMHKPVQLGALEQLFVNYDGARIVHFASMVVLGSFVVPHVALVIADGWNTFRSMVVGWSRKLAPAPAAGRARKPRPSGERPEVAIEVPRRRLAAQSRRDFLIYGAGMVASTAAAWWLLPEETRARIFPGAARHRLDTLAARAGLTADRAETVLGRALTFDDDVAEALYSKGRRVRTYDRSEARPLRNNYNGRTPGAAYLSAWSLEVSGLASGGTRRLTIEDLGRRLARREQVTRLVCVEGWSGVAWWGGFGFADFLEAFPPAPGARWAAVRSGVNLDGAGRPDPYYVSIDLETARHAQTLLATHHEGRPLTLGHGAPLRLVAPMKLGLKNVKAITEIAYSAAEPRDYWNERGYSKYDGL